MPVHLQDDCKSNFSLILWISIDAWERHAYAEDLTIWHRRETFLSAEDAIVSRRK